MTDEAVSAIGLRLKEFRQSLGKTSREMAASLGLHQASMAMVETGRNLFSMLTLAKLVELHGLNANWLLTGYGPMKLRPIPGRVAEAQGQHESLYSLVPVPILSTFLSLGEPVPQEDEQIVDWMSLIRPLVPHPRNTYALHAHGDSMSPKIENGDLVVVDTHEDAIRPYENLEGHPVALRLNDGVSIKWMDVGKNDWWVQGRLIKAGITSKGDYGAVTHSPKRQLFTFVVVQKLAGRCKAVPAHYTQQHAH